MFVILISTNKTNLLCCDFSDQRKLQSEAFVALHDCILTDGRRVPVILRDSGPPRFAKAARSFRDVLKHNGCNTHALQATESWWDFNRL